ncbi:LacI family DNA-binding transcriptional regulator [Cellulomonas marina]|uniref:LacI family transcriptional regulator n=1 Tax=Cellulomonas marina TaxID=988821 RepID=A0A1I1AAL8_9CELL|nr:LacI family DNA-binding transcriptional regulator [Cellulomonas marina]GIG29588.1 alanine racemase [Cellulomonas marina]SFB33443.1 LacI family transcriptional regulator [Cellulomonas marina]
MGGAGLPPAAGTTRGRTTLDDVARSAGVSRTTVSFVLNDRPNSGIPEGTRARVLEAAASLGYRPNRLARNLRLQRTGSLGLYVPDENLDAHFPVGLAYLQPLLHAAEERGCQVVTFTGGTDPVGRYADLVAAHAVDGFVLTDSAVDDPRARYLDSVGMPFSSIGRTSGALPQRWVDIDNAAAIGLAVDHLVALGHRRIAYLGPGRSHYWWAERVDGFRAAMARHGLPVPPGWVASGDDDELQAVATHLLARPDRPTAVVTPGDAATVPVYRACARAGLVVGPDLSVTGFDPLLWMLDPALTTLTVDHDLMARTAVDACLRAVEGLPDATAGTYVEVHLRPGSSTAPLPVP